MLCCVTGASQGDDVEASDSGDGSDGGGGARAAGELPSALPLASLGAACFRPPLLSPERCSRCCLLVAVVSGFRNKKPARGGGGGKEAKGLRFVRLDLHIHRLICRGWQGGGSQAGQAESGSERRRHWSVPLLALLCIIHCLMTCRSLQDRVCMCCGGGRRPSNGSRYVPSPNVLIRRFRVHRCACFVIPC